MPSSRGRSATDVMVAFWLYVIAFSVAQYVAFSQVQQWPRRPAPPPSFHARVRAQRAPWDAQRGAVFAAMSDVELEPPLELLEETRAARGGGALR